MDVLVRAVSLISGESQGQAETWTGTSMPPIWPAVTEGGIAVAWIGGLVIGEKGDSSFDISKKYRSLAQASAGGFSREDGDR